MKDRIILNRKQANTPVISNPLLTDASHPTKLDSSFTHSTPSRHDLSRIAPFYQAKLSISQPGDTYEREADTVAQKVMQMGDSSLQQQSQHQAEEQVQTKPVSELITPLVQREELPEEEELQMKPADNFTIQREELPEEEEELQMKPADNLTIQREELPEEEEEELQMKSEIQRAAQNEGASEDISSKLQSRKGGGSPLADNVRGFMEPRFGADFSNVKVHTDGEAVQMAQSVGAQAFAYGSDVYFGAGKSPGNNELTAHELTHVVQQTGAKK